MKNKIHIDRLKAIRPFVEFNYNINSIKKGNLSAYDKRKIKEYYDAISAATAQPNYAYKPRNKAHRKAALEYANQADLKQLKTVFIPVPRQGMKPELKFTKNGLVTKTGFVETRQISFNKFALIKDRQKEVKRVLEKFPEKYRRFTIQCGQYEYLAAAVRSRVDSEVARLMERYGNEDKNNYFGNWLNGLYGYEFINQSTEGAYFAAKSRARKELQKQRRNVKRKNKRLAQK